MAKDYISVERVSQFFKDNLVEAVKYYNTQISTATSEQEREKWKQALQAVQPLHTQYVLAFPEILIKQVNSTEEVQRAKESELAEKSKEETKPVRKNIYNSLGTPMTGPEADKRKRMFPDNPRNSW